MSVIGYGAKIQINDGASAAFVDVDDVTQIDMPDEVWGTAESKRLNLPAALILSVPTLKKAGELKVTYENNKTTWDRINVLKTGGTPSDRPQNMSFKITIPNTPGASPATYTRTIPGFVIENKLDSVEADKIQTATFTVAINGPAT
jgi:hypothetical protein